MGWMGQHAAGLGRIDEIGRRRPLTRAGRVRDLRVGSSPTSNAQNYFTSAMPALTVANSSSEPGYCNAPQLSGLFPTRPTQELSNTMGPKAMN